MQHLLGPAPATCGRKFENRADIRVPTSLGCAVETPNGVEDQATKWLGPVRPIEAKEHLLYPAPVAVGRQLKHCTYAVSAAFAGCAVQIAGRVEDHAGWIDSVTAVAEAMHYLLRPASAGCGRLRLRRLAQDHRKYKCYRQCGRRRARDEVQG